MSDPTTTDPVQPAARAGAHGSGIATAAASIAVIVVIARIVGLVRVFVLSNVLGPTALGDTYLTANKLPNILFDVVAGGALSSVVVPVLSRPIATGDDEETSRTASAMLTWTVLVLVPVAALGMALSGPLMSVMLSGVGDPALRAAKVDLGSRMLVVFMPQIVLYGAGIVLTGVLQAHRRFLAPALGPLLSSLVVIGVYLAYGAQSDGRTAIAELSRAQELTLSIGTTLGVAALTLPLLVPVHRVGLRLRPRLRMSPGVARQIRRLAAAGAVALGAQQLATAVVLILANRVVGGAVVYELAWTVFLVPWAVLAVPIATSAFPSMTEAVALDDHRRYAQITSGALRAVVIVSTFATALVAATAYPVATLLLRLFDPVGTGAGVTELARALVLFAPGLAGSGLVALLSRALYAREKGWWPAAATAFGFAAAALVDIALAQVVADDWLIAALGAGNTLGMTLAAGLLLRAVRREGVGMTAGAVGTIAATVAASSAATATGLFVAAAMRPFDGVRAVIALLVVVLVATVVYAAAVFALRRDDVIAFSRRRPVRRRGTS